MSIRECGGPMTTVDLVDLFRHRQEKMHIHSVVEFLWSMSDALFFRV